jgi:membrane protein DedA with SNARE-associated domain
MDIGTLTDWLLQHGALMLFLFLVLGIVGLPIPDETLLGIAGGLMSQGKLHAIPVFVAGVAGAWCGISLSYGIGRVLGNMILLHPPRWLRGHQPRLERVHRWFDHGGRWALLFGYFVPGFRHLVALAAGSGRMPFAKFFTFAGSGGVVWVTVFLGLGYSLGSGWTQMSTHAHHVTLIILAIGVVVAAVVWWIRQRQTTTIPSP